MYNETFPNWHTFISGYPITRDLSCVLMTKACSTTRTLDLHFQDRTRPSGAQGLRLYHIYTDWITLSVIRIH